VTAIDSLTQALNDALPQTQCTRCGYADCHAYADAMARGQADINQCPPGGAEGIARLARISGRRASPLNPANGTEGPRQLAVIDEAWCIGCTLCLKACPVDCIIGGPQAMHTVINELCSGCELCIPACPVDCISLMNVSGALTGWQAWNETQADEARSRHAFHLERTARDERERTQRLTAKAAALNSTGAAAPAPSGAAVPDAKRDAVQAAIARARARKPA